MAITRRQKEVIDFLSGFTQRNGYSPSYEEIAAGLGLNSLATVHKHVTNLQTKGLLQRAHNRSRSIDVLPQRKARSAMDRLPLMGRIAAGKPVEAIEHAETISLGDILGNRECYALEVRGDSMRDEHIMSGDYVLVERPAPPAKARSSSPSSTEPTPPSSASTAKATSSASNPPTPRWPRSTPPPPTSPSRARC